MKQNARRLHAVVHNVAAAPAVINGSCASFAAGIPKGRACAPVLFERPRVGRRPFLAPLRERSAEKRGGLAQVPLAAGEAARHAWRGASPPWRRRRASRRSTAATFGSRVRVSRDEAFAPVPVQRAPRGGVLVPPDRVPRPPGGGVTSPARKRRTLFHLRNVSRRRPQ